MMWLILAKFLKYLGFSVLLGRIVSRWIYGPVWSKLPLSWPIAGSVLLLLGAGLEVGVTLHSLGFTSPADILDYLSTVRQGRAEVAAVLGSVLLLLAELGAVWWLGPVGVLFVAGGLAAGGHAAEQGMFWATLDGLHALAAATWVGGLLALGVQYPTASEAQNFSKVALSSVVILLLSGVAAALRHLPAGAWWPALTGSSWGLILLGKLALMLLALLLALVVRSRLAATTSRVVQRATRRSAAATPQARGWLVAETALLFCVLGLSGALSSSPLPAASEVVAQTITVQTTLGSTALTGQLTLQGRGEIRLDLFPAVPHLSARLLMTDHPMPPQALPLRCDAAHCQGQAQLWMSGNWVIELTQDGKKVRVPFRY